MDISKAAAQIIEWVHGYNKRNTYAQRREQDRTVGHVKK